MENKEKSFALELLEDFKKQNKRMFVIIILILCFWLSTIGVFVYYICNYGYETTTETIEQEATSDNGSTINQTGIGR